MNDGSLHESALNVIVFKHAMIQTDGQWIVLDLHYNRLQLTHQNIIQIQ